MTLPQDDALIVEKPKSWGPPTEVVMGHVRNICETCGRDWIGPHYCGQGTCRGISFTEKVVHVTPMVIESMPAPNKASATALLERKVRIEVQSAADVALLRTLRTQLVTVEQTMLQADAVLHRILGRVPLDIEAIFTEATTLQEKSDREARMWSNPNKQVWYALQSAVHFAAGTEGDIPVGSDVPNRGSLVLQCRHLVAEIDAAINRYEEALRK